eukprot:COSAG02_NODE_82_length_39723_cov_247.146650_22_plen_174_part_00
MLAERPVRTYHRRLRDHGSGAVEAIVFQLAVHTRDIGGAEPWAPGRRNSLLAGSGQRSDRCVLGVAAHLTIHWYSAMRSLSMQKPRSLAAATTTPPLSSWLTAPSQPASHTVCRPRWLVSVRALFPARVATLQLHAPPTPHPRAERVNAHTACTAGTAGSWLLLDLLDLIVLP